MTVDPESPEKIEADIRAIESFENRSLAAFQYSAYPVLRKNCASCHNSNSSSAAKAVPHSDEMAEISQNTLLEFRLVSFSDLSQSRILKVLEKDQHRAMSLHEIRGLADALSKALQKWNDLRGPVPVLSEEDQIRSIPDFDLRDKAAFRSKLHPIMVESCGSCHQSNGITNARNIPHSDPAVDTSFQTLELRSLVNYKYPELSRILSVFNPGNHNSATIPNPEVAKEKIRAGVSAWIDLRGDDPDQEQTTAEILLPRIEPQSGSGAGLSDRNSAGQLVSVSRKTVVVPLGNLFEPKITDPARSPELRFEVIRSGAEFYQVENLSFRNPAGNIPLSLNSVRVYLNGQKVSTASGFASIKQVVTSPAFTPVTAESRSVFLESRCKDDTDLNDAASRCSDSISFSFGWIGFESPDRPEFVRLKQFIREQCSSCHTGVSRPTTYSFLSGGDYRSGSLPDFASAAMESMSEAQYIASLGLSARPYFLTINDPEKSILSQVLQSTPAPLVSQMPKGVSWTDEQRRQNRQIIDDWILTIPR
ncbi:MAG: hypothetical protein KGQ59_00610 [Bdellovibrionales bacterium]|nr:hypothetical protein [Bdellovibrionales bacterium]